VFIRRTKYGARCEGTIRGDLKRNGEYLYIEVMRRLITREFADRIGTFLFGSYSQHIG
jgi:hypothetical protein